MIVTYCGCFIEEQDRSVYLPRVAGEAHVTLFSSTSRTVLKQTFINPRRDATLEEVNYAFPLYDGISVVGFTCHIDGRVIKGTVKEREEAKQVYEKAKEQNQFAGLLQQSQQAADMWMTSLGNLPSGATVSVEITFLGELKHDAEVDGLRYTLPSIIAPRFGPQDSLTEADNVVSEGMSLTIDAEMPSAIKSVQSPSHALSVSIGTLSAEPDAEPSFKRASATLTLSSSHFDKDFVLQIVAADIGDPSAMMETHPTHPNQQALMTTLVPKFGLPPLKPEIVFLCDRSGSMNGKIEDLINALQIFVKSLPVGVKFNICSFGTQYEFLWPKSASYDEKSLEEALEYIKNIHANFGGTVIDKPMKEVFARRYGDIELEVIMLTDGQISSQDAFFKTIQDEVTESAGAVRVFSLGVGSGASSSLVEGAARVGNGASQMTADGEKMEMKIIRLLKASLSPHITDYTLEIKYEKDEDDDFELIEKVMTEVSLDVETDETMTAAEEEKSTEPQQPISLFDKKYKEVPLPPGMYSSSKPAKRFQYDDLPEVPVPSYVQAPYDFPPLYAFNRTSVYVLLSKVAPGLRAKSVMLRGTSKHGPLELEIEIQHLKQPGTTLHQLAARKAVDDLEKTGGWLSRSKTNSGSLLKDKMPSRFEDFVGREAIRLGVLYQISSKWTSFVAVDENSHDDSNEGTLRKVSIVKKGSRFYGIRKQKMARASVESGKRGFAAGVGKARRMAPKADPSTIRPPPAEGFRTATFGGAATDARCAPSRSPVMARVRPTAMMSKSHDDEAMPLASTARSCGLDERFVRNSEESLIDYSDEDLPAPATYVPKSSETPLDPRSKMHRIVALQAYNGSWQWSPELEAILSLDKKNVMALSWPTSDEAATDRVSASVCVIVYLKKNLPGEKETWEMIVDKAQSWLKETTGQTSQDLEALVQNLVQG